MRSEVSRVVGAGDRECGDTLAVGAEDGRGDRRQPELELVDAVA